MPASILDFANRLLAEAAPGVTPCRSVRSGGRPPVFVPAGGALGDEVRRALAELTASFGTVAAVVPDDLRSELEDLPGPVTLLRPPEAKGLEFDAVVVVEPAAIAAGTARGLRLLYVALTRAVQELVVVHARPLPEAMAAGPATR